MIRRYIIWRNRHAGDTRLRQVVARANVAGPATARTTSPQSAVLVLMSGASRVNSRNPTL
jgi:hypothetical protein